MPRKKQLTYPEALNVLRAAYEQEKIQLTVKISTLEVTISQLQGELNRREKEREEYNPTDVSAIYREKYPSVFQPVPHPYTHPIRDIGTSGKIKGSKSNA